MIRSDYTLQALLQNDLFTRPIDYEILCLELDPPLIENYKLYVAYWVTMCQTIVNFWFKISIVLIIHNIQRANYGT